VYNGAMPARAALESGNYRMPVPALIETVEVVEERHVRVPSRPMTFDEFVDLPADVFLELVSGNLVDMLAAELNHEKLKVWLLQTIGVYVERRKLGIVLGSRTAVKIHEFGGRLPDVVFVRQTQIDIVQQKGIYGPPDLIIEVISPGARLSELVEKEAEYRLIGVKEFWQIDPKRGMVSVLTKRENDYLDSRYTDGPIESAVVDGLSLRAEWLQREPRPDAFDVITRLLANVSSLS